jgi:2-phospho-L-lactate guanylyltransferase
MSIWAIIPVKPFLQSKSRLASILSPEERAGLSQTFLSHALRVLSTVPDVARMLVISRDPAALALARDYRALTLTETGRSDLNAALERATQTALTSGASAVLILPADLPQLSPNDVQQLVSEPGADPAVVITPDRHESGTNALLIRPPGLIPYAFGPRSFQRHQSLAARAGARVHIRRLPTAALDVDVPEDWHLYLSRKETSRWG